ncbi:MAG: hypothetical protein WCF17_08285, partial [Terracidiphilus sp.]
TQRSLVQIQPPQPFESTTYMLLPGSHQGQLGTDNGARRWLRSFCHRIPSDWLHPQSKFKPQTIRNRSLRTNCRSVIWQTRRSERASEALIGLGFLPPCRNLL